MGKKGVKCSVLLCLQDLWYADAGLIFQQLWIIQKSFHFYTASVFIQHHGIPSIYWATMVISNANKDIFFLSYPESLYIFLYPKATYCHVAMQWTIALLLIPIKEIIFPEMKIFYFVWAWQCFFFCSGDISAYILSILLSMQWCL